MPAEKSIEFRPESANTREEYGHWESDLVIGKREKSSALFTLTERKTREEIIVKIPGKKAEYVIAALDKIERRFIPKGTDITPISEEYIQWIENWMNNLLRPMFGFKSALQFSLVM